MRSLRCKLLIPCTLAACAFFVVGCGTTRSSDTNRTATEQLLISDAIDRAVQTINLQSLEGQTVYLDDSRLGDVVDRNYLVSTLRQHLLASGCYLSSERDQAEFVVEARAGAIGTDRNDLLFGVPSINVPQILPTQPMPAAIPEIPIAKRRDQRGIAKIAVFAYHRESGMPVWQSGLAHEESSANDVWILGAGPFQRGTIYDGTAFAGNTITGEDGNNAPAAQKAGVALGRPRTFNSPAQIASRNLINDDQHDVVHAEHEEQVASDKPATSSPEGQSEAAPTQPGANQNVQTSGSLFEGGSAGEISSQLPYAEQPAAFLQGITDDAVEPRSSVSAEVSQSSIYRTQITPVPRPFPLTSDLVPLPQPRVGRPEP